MSLPTVTRSLTQAEGFLDEASAPASRATLLFTDVVDSTALSSELGDARMATLWASHDRAARALMQRYRGREIDKTDGFLLLFEHTTDAVQFAIAYHAALATLRPPVRARVGLHVGDVSQRENAPEDIARGAKPLEVDGLAKPIAARVMEIAQGGQTLVSADAVLALGDDFFGKGATAGRPQVMSHGPWMLKGVLRPIEIFEVGMPGLAPFATPPDAAKGWRVRGEDGSWVPVRAVGHRLPAEVDAFVGREADLRALASRLEGGARLVNLLGLGGMGKTRLAVRYGWIWLGAWPGGIYFADLSDARDLAGIVSAVSDALDVPLGQEDPVQQLGQAIAGHGRCLVILDNFEQVARFAEGTVGRWLEAAHEATFLVTSREVLGLPGEQAVPLPAMSAQDAAALFVRRAASSKAGYVATEDDREAIAELVGLLDCLPLAIELAAARVRVMPPRTLLLRMDERFRLLTSAGGRRERHATLRAMLDWSWALLSPAEQATLAQLSVFERGFTLETAEAVVDGGAGWVIDLVQSLVDKSLVRFGSADRFDLLNAVQAYAAEHLTASGERVSTEIRHGRYFAALGESGGTEKSGVELDNLTSACRRAVAAGDAVIAVGALEGAWGALNLRGPYAAGVELARAVGGVPELTPSLRAKVDRVAGVAWLRAGRADDAKGPLEAALAASRAVGDRWTEGVVLGYLSVLPHERGLLAEARPLYEAALSVHREVGNRRSAGVVLGNCARLLFEQGHVDEALARFDEAIDAHREVGDVRAEGVVLGNLGGVYVEIGQIEQARQCYETALVSHRAVGDRRSEGVALANLGLLAHDAGRLDEARAHAHAALVLHREVGDRRAVGLALSNLGNLYRLSGRAPAARKALEGALRIHREIGFRYGLPFACCGLAQLEATEGREAAATSLIDEAVLVSRPYPAVHVETLAARARIRLGFGWVADAEADVEAAAALAPRGRSRAVVEATRALVCAYDGAPAEAREALAWLDDHPQFSAANSEVGRIAAEARARVR